MPVHALIVCVNFCTGYNKSVPSFLMNQLDLFFSCYLFNQLFQATGYMFLPKSVPENLSMQELCITLGHGRTKTHHTVLVVYGVYDLMTTEYKEESNGQQASTFCNQSWEHLFQRTGIMPSDLWLPGTVSVLTF